jgi:selenocysteine lyase/cysteine desulfurase
MARCAHRRTHLRICNNASTTSTGIETPVFDGIIRASFQGYNDDSDLDAFAAALSELCTRAGA